MQEGQSVDISLRILMETTFTIISVPLAHVDERFLQFSGLYSHTGPISLCIDSFVFVCICVFFVSYCIVVVSL